MGRFSAVRFVRNAVGDFGESLFCRRSELLRELDSDGRSPDWIDADDLAVVRRRRDQVVEFSAALQTPATEGGLSITPEEPFESLRFSLVDVAPGADFEVTVRLDHEDGTESRHQTSYRNGRYNERRIVPVSFDLDTPATRAEVSVSTDRRTEPNYRDTVREAVLGRLKGGDVWQTRDASKPSLSVPTVGRSSGTPIFLISVDTLRYDRLEKLSALTDVLGPDAVVPAEPRTQGASTWPSHASILTGVHPGRHGCHGQSSPPQIDLSVPMIPEVLSEEGYACSGIVSTGNLRPERGFARGFHRFDYRPMSWTDRSCDARSNVDRALAWLERDSDHSNRLFYFLHFFDPHYPYLPPFPVAHSGIDQGSVERFLDQGEVPDYVTTYESDPFDIDPRDLDDVTRYYTQSVEYVARQLRRLVSGLKRLGLFEESLIIVTGDHGEDFYERGFIFHRSLYDTNIRPAMVVKPPAESDMRVPDEADLVDIFPSVVDLVGATVSTEGAGRSWLAESPAETEPRITERFGEWYNVAVEIDDLKGVFTYEASGDGRPETVADGPELREFYDLSAVRDGDYREATEADRANKDRLQSVAEEFVRSGSRPRSVGEGQQLPREVTDRLSELGYK